jgi:hypothetical protein
MPPPPLKQETTAGEDRQAGTHEQDGGAAGRAEEGVT